MLDKLIKLMDGQDLKKLAENSGVSNRQLYRVIRKEAIPSIVKAEKIAKALGYKLELREII